jgi:pimeloyl-ACP methyl ester carboxylesterase
MHRQDQVEARIQPGLISGLIDVGTTQLYHDMRGSGPPLLFITGATGDADEWAQITPALVSEFTVVTYDRRGFSRSPRPPGWTATSVGEQADDAAALLRTLELTPATVVGHSSGASIACALVAQHPALVRHAVLYEAPLFAVIPGGEQIAAGMRAAVEEALAAGGPRHAMEMFMRQNAGDETFELFAAADPQQLERVLNNGAVFFPLELRPFMAFVPDREQLRASGVPLTVVVGEQNRHTWFGAAATWLADGAGAGLVELPGGHAGFVADPQAFIELVRRSAR